jgi:hypothetical protein
MKEEREAEDSTGGEYGEKKPARGKIRKTQNEAGHDPPHPEQVIAVEPLFKEGLE